MPRETAVLEAQRRLRSRPASEPRLRPLPTLVPRVVDVALFYGQRSGGIRTYIDAKARWAARTGAIEHHVIVPGSREWHGAGMHRLHSPRMAAANGYRLPLARRALRETLRGLRPDIVVLHDPFWHPLAVARTAHDTGARVVAVHHGSIALDAAGLPGRDATWKPLLRRWMQRSYAEADHVMSAVPCKTDCGRGATLTLRFGLHPAFAPQPDTRRGDHVLYVGRLAREKGVIELLHAAARSAEPWPLRLVGSGPAEGRLRRLADRLGIADRLQIGPYVADEASLARLYAGARAVVMPGAHETFGLVGFEAAACGASVVTCATAPSVAQMRGMVRTYEPGDIEGLRDAIEAARAADPDRHAAAALAARCTWPAAFEAELEDLERLRGAWPRPGAA